MSSTLPKFDTPNTYGAPEVTDTVVSPTRLPLDLMKPS